MTDQKEPILDLETARSLDAQCLVLEMSEQTWHVPFDTLQAIPRVGETNSPRQWQRGQSRRSGV